jgi:F-type H+-transporting ATPase subunit b
MRSLILALTFTSSVAFADLVPEHPAPHGSVAAAAHGGDHATPAGTAAHGTPAAHGTADTHGPAAHGEATTHGGHVGAAQHGEHAEGQHALAPINWSDFDNKKQPPYAALLINLAVLLGIYFYFGKKPVVEGLKKRKEDIAKEIEDAARMKKDAEARAKKYQASLANLDADLETTKKGLEKEKLVAEAKIKSDRMLKDAAFLVAQESKQAHIDLKREAVEGSFSHAETFLSSRVTDDDHDRLCLEFLTELSKKAANTEVSR